MVMRAENWVGEYTSTVGDGDIVTKYAYLISHNDFVLYVYGLDKPNGWITMLENDDILYYDNYVKYI